MTPVEQYILELPENLKPLVKKIRHLIISASPFIEEKLVYGIPFFYGKKRIFYITPKKDNIDFGFCNGYLMAENRLLQIKDRTQVRTITIYKLSEIKDEVLIPLIHEAIIIDENKDRI